jgi:hypothetical protein
MKVWRGVNVQLEPSGQLQAIAALSLGRESLVPTG